jgi:hypothetical protein
VPDVIEMLFNQPDTAGYAVELLDAEPDDHWMHRFLGPGLVECLTPNSLQAVFRAFAPMTLVSGAIVVREGDPADLFYVIANGSAEVRRDGRRLATLLPGDSFGADALVSQGRRNASVGMLCDGRVMCLAAEMFRYLVSDHLVRWVDRAVPGALAIDISQRPRGPDGLRMLAGELDLGATYVFDGGAEGDRALAAFLAAQRGVRVFARCAAARADVSGATRPGRYDPSPTHVAPVRSPRVVPTSGTCD